MLGPLKKFSASSAMGGRTPPDSCCCPPFQLENSRTGRQWTRPALDIFLCTRNAQHIRRLEGREKNGLRNAVHNDVLRELILRMILPTRTTRRGSDNGRYVNQTGVFEIPLQCGFDHGVGYPLLLLYDAKAPSCGKNNEFKDLGHYSEWPKMPAALILTYLYHRHSATERMKAPTLAKARRPAATCW